MEAEDGLPLVEEGGLVLLQMSCVKIAVCARSPALKQRLASEEDNLMVDRVSKEEVP